MEPDFSFTIYEKYCCTSNKMVEIKLLDQRIIKGQLIGLYKNNPNDKNPYIAKWCLESPDQKYSLGLDYLGYASGKIILQEEIDEIKFIEDQTILKRPYD
ncbi:MAG: hypothetical protein IPO72_16360 [Saprospiraceae bacterium]|nr:hypothetical protein [Candidatus Vicinibacter affinis]